MVLEKIFSPFILPQIRAHVKDQHSSVDVRRPDNGPGGNVVVNVVRNRLSGNNFTTRSAFLIHHLSWAARCSSSAMHLVVMTGDFPTVLECRFYHVKSSISNFKLLLHDPDYITER